MATSPKRSKRYKDRAELVDGSKQYDLQEAVQILKKFKTFKTDETVAVNFRLGIKPDQSDQLVRGTVSLPHGSGKSIRIICFAKGESARAAEEAGADVVGAEELVKKVQDGWVDFDAVVAHPDMMREVSKLGRVLGPRGLMPTPKIGTVTPQVEKAINELKAGRVEFKSDKTSGVHVVFGKLSFSEEALVENAGTVLRAVRDAKPPTSKGEYFRRIAIAPTFGPGLKISVGSV